jgi:hypothetical protein
VHLAVFAGLVCLVLVPPAFAVICAPDNTSGDCNDGDACDNDSACSSNLCVNPTCASCSNGYQDGNETGVD